MIRVFLLALTVVIFEAFYNLAGGRLVSYFSPLWALQVSAFVGLLLGPAKAVWWGTWIGLLEDLYFASNHTAVGLSAFVYVWTGWISGRLFHGRADAANPAMGAALTALSLVFGLVMAKILAAAFGAELSAFPSAMTWQRFLSLAVQVAIGPVLLKILAWLLPREEAGAP